MIYNVGGHLQVTLKPVLFGFSCFCLSSVSLTVYCEAVAACIYMETMGVTEFRG